MNQSITFSLSVLSVCLLVWPQALGIKIIMMNPLSSVWSYVLFPQMWPTRLTGYEKPITHLITYLLPCSGELQTQKLESHLVRTQSLNVLPFNPGVGQYVSIHAMLTARDFFLAYFYPSSPFTCIFFQHLSQYFLCWLWLTMVPVWAHRTK